MTLCDGNVHIRGDIVFAINALVVSFSVGAEFPDVVGLSRGS